MIGPFWLSYRFQNGETVLAIVQILSHFYVFGIFLVFFGSFGFVYVV
jgi:hypothetical protein